MRRNDVVRRSAGVGATVMMIATLVFGVSPVDAGAAGESPGCQVTATAEGFDVRWDAAADSATNYIVERRVFDRFWWRGRTAQTSLSDGPAPRGAASVAYRVRTKAADGSVGPWTACEVTTTPGASCQQRPSSSGGFELTFDTGSTATDDFVIRRQVREGGTFWWRLRTDEPMAIDGPSPTGTANYLVWAREDRVIVAAMTCGVAPAACQQPAAQEGIEQSPMQVDPALLADIAEFSPIEDSAVGPNGFVYFVQENAPGRDYVYRLDPATGDIEEWGALGTFDFFPTHDILAVDALGGVWTTYSDRAGSYWEYSNAGTTTTVADLDQLQRDGIFALGNLSDGRVVLRRVEPGIDRFELFTPTGPGVDNGEVQILVLPPDARRVTGATTDDRISVLGPDFTYALPLSCFLD